MTTRPNDEHEIRELINSAGAAQHDCAARPALHTANAVTATTSRVRRPR